MNEVKIDVGEQFSTCNMTLLALVVHEIGAGFSCSIDCAMYCDECQAWCSDGGRWV